MTVDGVPNVRTCIESVREGMQVRHQNAWPSLEHDAMSVLDRFELLMPVGFYYKTFHTPSFFWQLGRHVIRRIAGLGSIDTDLAAEKFRHEYLHTDVAVVGGGVAGMAAALAAAQAGARVTLLDEQPYLGGISRLDTKTRGSVLGFAQSTGYRIAAELASRAQASEPVEILSGSSVFGLYEGNLLGVLSKGRLIWLRARKVVCATGSQEIPMAFDRNDLPGVMLGSGAQRLIHLYGVKPGSTAVVLTTNDQGYVAALDLLQAGVRVAAVVDQRQGFPHILPEAMELRARGIVVLDSHIPIRAEGTKRVLGVTVARVENGRPSTDEREIDCDIISMSGGLEPVNALLYQGGASFEYDEYAGVWAPLRLPAGLYAAGSVKGAPDMCGSISQGDVAGGQAAASLGMSPKVRVSRRLNDESEPSHSGEGEKAPSVLIPEPGSKKFVCFCEDVTVKDIETAVDEGFEDIQTLKRYTTATMGPCQGKMCHKMLVAVAARRTGQSISEMGVTTARPPVQPVPIAALAGPAHLPVKRTQLDHTHRSLGALMGDAGQWRRPYHYGSPEEECEAVRQRVGIIDVSTLGKLDVQGLDAPAFLDRVYTHLFSTLRPGQVRYGLLCADNGAILDDGTVARLADDHYFVTTSTANIDTIEEWFKWWIAGTDRCVHVTNVTSALSVINVAGPKARDTLTKLTDIDLSPKGFGYMRSKRGEVAGVSTLLIRIGFVGETGWELHFPSEYAQHMWDTVLDAGQEFGMVPFGTEAQRILRLEKKHIIPGQDTDLLSTPLDSDAAWVVRFEKDDFIGRGGLIAARDLGSRNTLVGFVMEGDEVPEDGDPVVSGSKPVGRVTSSRRSPTIGKGFGLAIVPVELGEQGNRIHVRIDGELRPAQVTKQAIYDPDGKRLRT